MKLNIAYLLLLLVISPNLYGSEAEGSALATQDANDKLQCQTIKGLTELTEKWEQKTIPSKWVKKGSAWVEQTIPRSRQLATFVILGADSTLNAYHFIESQLYGKELLYTPLKDDAEKISLSSGKSEKIKQFGKAIRSSKSSTLGSHLTFVPEHTDANIFDQDSKAGYRSQLLAGLIATQEDYKETQDKGALQRSLVVVNALAHEIQKSAKAIALRKKQIFEKNDVVEHLKKEIVAFNPAISDEFVFYMNALIDVRQSENLFEQATSTDGQVVESIFNTADDRFILNSRELVTKTKNNTEVIFEFGNFVKKDGRLPVEECALQARKIYKGWRTSFGEPTEAAKLRACHDKLMQARREFQATSEVDKRLFIQKQIEILQEERNDVFNSIKENVFEAAKQLTTKDLVAYSDNINNRKRLAYAQDYLSDEQSIVAIEEQELAHNLLYMTAYQRSLAVPTTKTIMELIGCDAATAELLAQQVNSMYADLNDPLLQHHEDCSPANDDKGKEEVSPVEVKKSLHTEVLPKPQQGGSDTEDDSDAKDEENLDQQSAQSSTSSSSSNSMFGWWN